jgi:hypothetical protein
MTPESALKNKIRIRLSELGYIPLRLNVGTFFTADGRPVSTGLPEGTSDLVAIEPGTGRAVFIETKIHPRKPTQKQIDFIRAVQKQGCIAGVVYSVADLEKLLQKNTLQTF